MALLARMPTPREVAQPLFDRPYTPGECWVFVRDVLHAGGFVEAQATSADALAVFQELWRVGDPDDPLALAKPWDLYLLRKTGPAVGHVALVADPVTCLHVRTRGVCVEPLRRMVPRLFQIARLTCVL